MLLQSNNLTVFPLGGVEASDPGAASGRQASPGRTRIPYWSWKRLSKFRGDLGKRSPPPDGSEAGVAKRPGRQTGDQGRYRAANFRGDLGKRSGAALGGGSAAVGGERAAVGGKRVWGEAVRSEGLVGTSSLVKNDAYSYEVD